MNAAKHEPVSMTTFNFHGDPLDVVATPGDGHWVVLAKLCAPFGIRPEEQAKKLRRLTWAQTVKITLWEGNLRREVFCLNIRSVAGWLFTLNAGKVAPHLREKLATYQRECADALADHFLGPRRAAAPSMDAAALRDLMVAVATEVATQVVGQVLRQALGPIAEQLRAMQERLDNIPTGVIAGVQADRIRTEVDYVARLLVSLGDFDDVRAARMSIQNLVTAASGWAGTGRRRHLMPASVFSEVMATLQALRLQAEGRARRCARAQKQAALARRPQQTFAFTDKPN